MPKVALPAGASRPPSRAEKAAPVVAPAPPTFADLVKKEIGAGVKSSDDAIRVGQAVETEWNRRETEKRAALERKLEALRAQSLDGTVKRKSIWVDMDQATQAWQDAAIDHGLTSPQAQAAETKRLELQKALKTLDAQQNKEVKTLMRVNKELGTLKQDTLKATLGEVRELGGVALAWTSGSAAGAKARVDKASKLYPKEWLEASNAAGKLRGELVRRGYYGHSDDPGRASTIALSGAAKDLLRVAVHELGHRFEYSVAGLKKLEAEFYARRTAGELLIPIGGGHRADEKTRKDQFVDPYMGKDYKGGGLRIVDRCVRVAVYREARSEQGSRDAAMGSRHSRRGLKGAREKVFKVKGRFDGREVEVTWDAGQLSGDGWTAHELGILAAALEGEDVGPTCGPYTTTRHLEDPLSALVLLCGMLEPDPQITGDVPEPDAVPEGAVV